MRSRQKTRFLTAAKNSWLNCSGDLEATTPDSVFQALLAAPPQLFAAN
jgi:hypothetical protein